MKERFSFLQSLRAAISLAADVRDHRRPDPADLKQLGLEQTFRNHSYFRR